MSPMRLPLHLFGSSLDSKPPDHKGDKQGHMQASWINKHVETCAGQTGVLGEGWKGKGPRQLPPEAQEVALRPGEAHQERAA